MRAQPKQADIAVVTHDDLRSAHGIAWGTPTRYGNMRAQMKHKLYRSVLRPKSGNPLFGRDRSRFAMDDARRGTDGLNWTWTSGPSPNNRVPRDRGSLYVRDFPGSGAAFVLLHGFPDNSHTFMTTSFHT